MKLSILQKFTSDHPVQKVKQGWFCLETWVEVKLVFLYRLSVKVIEWLRLEGTLKIIEFLPPCHSQEQLPLEQVAQAIIQPGLEHIQGWDIHIFPGQLTPVLHHSPSKAFFPTANLNQPSFSLKLFPLVLSLSACIKSPFPSFLYAPKALEGCIEVSDEVYISSGWTTPSQPVFVGKMLYPFKIFVASGLTLTDSRLFCVEDPRPGPSTPGGASQVQSRWVEPSPMMFWPLSFGGSSGWVCLSEFVSAHCWLMPRSSSTRTPKSSSDKLLSMASPSLYSHLGLTLTQVQHLALEFTELHVFPMSHFSSLSLCMASHLSLVSPAPLSFM